MLETWLAALQAPISLLAKTAPANRLYVTQDNFDQQRHTGECVGRAFTYGLPSLQFSEMLGILPVVLQVSANLLAMTAPANHLHATHSGQFVTNK